MRFIGADEVHRALDWAYLIDALRESHLSERPQSRRALLQQPRPGRQPNTFNAISSWQSDVALGVKLVASFPDNVERHGLPTVNALYAVFDAITGVPRAVIDGEALIFRKTAADSALGSKLLARPDARSLLMIGAGALAPYLIAAHRVACPSIERVTIWNRTTARAEALAARLRAGNVDARVVEQLDDALSAADVVSSATMSEAPLIKGARLKPGAHLDLVGAFLPSMREADDVTVRRARLFCDTIDCIERSGELGIPLAAGVITRTAIEGDLFDLCRGRIPARRSADEITLYKNGSGGHIDLFTAQALCRRVDVGN